MAITPTRSFRLSVEEQLMLAEIARSLGVSETEALRWLIRTIGSQVLVTEIELETRNADGAADGEAHND